MKREVEIIEQTTIIYDIKGESFGGFTVGDEVKTMTGRMRPYGEVMEILDAPHRQIFQLRLKSGWCCHPHSDEVEITKRFNPL